MKRYLPVGDLPIEPLPLGEVPAGAGVVEEPLPGEVLEPEPTLPLVPDEELPEAPEPDLLKCASHSLREICPSLLVSRDEKLGEALLVLEPPAEAEGRLVELLLEGDEVELLLEGDEVELLLDADGVDDGVDDDGVDDEEDDCAPARLDNANRTAAVMRLRLLNMEPPGCCYEKSCPLERASPVPVGERATSFRSGVARARRKALEKRN